MASPYEQALGARRCGGALGVAARKRARGRGGALGHGEVVMWVLGGLTRTRCCSGVEAGVQSKLF